MSAARLAEALDTLDIEAKGVVWRAHDEAYRHGSGILASAHLLLGLLDAPYPAAVSRVFDRHRSRDGASSREVDAQRCLGSAAVPAAIRGQVEHRLGAYIRPAPRLVHLPYSVHARAILIAAADRTLRSRPEQTGIADVWRALAHAPGSLAAHCLDDLGMLSELQQGFSL